MGLATIVAAVATVIALFRPSGSSGPPPQRSTPGVTAPASTNPESTAPAPPMTEPPEAPTSTNQGPVKTSTPPIVFLADLESITQSLDMNAESAEFNGRTYLHSLAYTCSDFCNDPQGVAEYNLGKRYRTFTAVVGVDDRVIDADQQAVFEVYIDGVRRRREQVSFRHPKKITVDVTDGVRLRLLASIGYVESPIQAGANIAGGVPNHLPHVAWGDAQISK